MFRIYEQHYPVLYQKYIKGNSWKNKIKKKRFLLKKLLFRNGRSFSPSHLNFEVATRNQRMVLKVTKKSLQRYF